MPKDTESAFLRKVGGRIKALREERGISQVALARTSGVSRVYLVGIEKGIRNVTILHLRDIARALKVPIGSLLEE